VDDKELIKKIMEEVKDEKLREELLSLVVEKNRKREDTKKEEEDPINYLARQAILGGATEEVAKLGWKIEFGLFSFFSIVFGFLTLFSFLGFLFSLFNKDENAAAAFLGIAIFSSIPALIAALGVYSLRSGKKEYERLKHKSAN
jgi:hypothetical protein